MAAGVELQFRGPVVDQLRNLDLHQIKSRVARREHRARDLHRVPVEIRRDRAATVGGSSSGAGIPAGQSGFTRPRPVARIWMRARECAGFEASSMVPVVASSRHGCAVESDQDSRRGGGQRQQRIQSGARRPGAKESGSVDPLASNGIWICDSVSVEASTGTRRPPACAEVSFAPRTLIKEPGAAARATRSAVLTTLGIAQAVRRQRGVNSESLHRGPQLVLARVQAHIGDRRLRQARHRLPVAGKAQHADIGAHEKNAGVGGDVNGAPVRCETAIPCTAASGRSLVSRPTTRRRSRYEARAAPALREWRLQDARPSPPGRCANRRDPPKIALPCRLAGIGERQRSRCRPERR